MILKSTISSANILGISIDIHILGLTGERIVRAENVEMVTYTCEKQRFIPVTARLAELLLPC